MLTGCIYDVGLLVKIAAMLISFEDFSELMMLGRCLSTTTVAASNTYVAGSGKNYVTSTIA